MINSVVEKNGGLYNAPVEKEKARNKKVQELSLPARCPLLQYVQETLEIRDPPFSLQFLPSGEEKED